MRQLTVTIPDDFYGSFVDYLKDKPEVNIYETGVDAYPRQVQQMVLYRVKNSKPEDYVSWEESKRRLDAKWLK